MARKLPEFLTEEERLAFLKVFNIRYPTGLRNLCMVRLGLNQGLRNAEIRSLKVSSVNWTTGRAKVHGKGSKERMVAFSDKDMEYLRRWRETRQTLPNPRGFLFSTLKGTELSGRYFYGMVQRKAQRAGIERIIHPHTLRHSFACDLYRETKNLQGVREALGHSSIQTTSIYLHLVTDELDTMVRGLRED